MSNPITSADIPDAMFPSNNEWGVPLLDITMQAKAINLPIERWGRLPRHGGKRTMGGTWHFYTDDYKFTALWKDPSPIINSGCVNIVEPNLSTNPTMPRAEVLHRIYRKRWLARLWQTYGIRTFVDLCIDHAHADLALLGVPYGWGAYATRAYGGMLHELMLDYQLANQRSGNTPLLFLVLGGGNEAKAMCDAYGWAWLPQENHIVEGRITGYGQI